MGVRGAGWLETRYLKEERVKQIAVFVCLVLCLAATSASAQAIRNPGFSSDLSSWMVYHEGANNSNPGTVTWEGAGSVLLEASGSPGTIGLAQPTCSAVSVGDSAWVNVNILSGSGATFSLTVGDNNGSGSNGQRADLTDPAPGSYRLVVHADKSYPQGTWYSFRILAWPGPMQARVSYADASFLAEETGRPPVVRPTMEVNPNPATGRTRVSFSMPQTCKGRLAVYDAAGNLVRSVERRLYSAGPHSAVWNGRDENGRSVSAGTYLVRLTTDDGREQTTSVVVTR
jgi:hypothetical protein